MRTPWWLAVGAAILPAVALPQAPAAPPSEPAITLPPVKAELVQIDVVVTDRDGRPVRGLKPEDFEILEDGKRQQITHFRDGRGRPLPVTADEPVVVTPEGPPPESTPEDWRGRYIVLAVDDLHMTPENLLQAKRSFRKFVDEQIGTDDLVAVVATSGTLGYYHPFTRPGPGLTRAIERLTPHGRMITGDPFVDMSEYQAEMIERGDRDALRLAVQEILQRQPGNTESSAASQAEATAHRIATETSHLSRITLATVEDVVRSLAPLPGRKVMVLASDGFLVGLGTRNSNTFDLREIVDAATRAGVVLYAVDTRGLVAMVPGGDASSSLVPVLSAPGVRESLQMQSESALRDALHTLADDTGGFVVASTNDLAAGFGRIVADNETYYVLAYEPTNGERDGRFRKIQVRLPGRRDLRVRTRRGYFAPDDRKAPSVKTLRAEAAADASARREADLQRGFASLFPLREVPVTLSADFVKAAPGSQVVVSAQVDLGKVNFVDTAGRQEATVEVVGAVYNEAGMVAANLQAERVAMALKPETHQRVLKEGLRYRKVVTLQPGLYQVRLVVREEGTSRIGSASEWIEVPDLASGKLALSSVFLSAGGPAAAVAATTAPAATAAAPAAGAPAVSAAPGSNGNGAEKAAAAGHAEEPLRDMQALKRFGRDDTLFFQLFVYNPRRDAANATDVILQAQVWTGPRMLAQSPITPVAVPEGAATVGLYTSSFPLTSFAPGSYELRITVNDRKSGQGQMRRVNFAVE